MQESLKRNGASQSSRVEDKPAADSFNQSREYYRVNLNAPLEWQLLDNLGQELDTHKGAVTDISGGGLAFNNVKCEDGTVWGFKSYGYEAGTGDCVVEMDGKFTVTDDPVEKTTKVVEKLSVSLTAM